MCDIQNNGKIQREFETRSTDDQPTIQWLPVVGSWTFLGVNMHFNEKLFMCDSCNFLVRAYLEGYQLSVNQFGISSGPVLITGLNRVSRNICAGSMSQTLYRETSCPYYNVKLS